MIKLDPKRKIFIAVFVVLASFIYMRWVGLQSSIPAQHSQIQIEPQATEPARQGENEHQTVTPADTKEQQVRQAAQEAAAEHTRYLARYLNSDASRKPG